MRSISARAEVTEASDPRTTTVWNPRLEALSVTTLRPVGPPTIRAKKPREIITTVAPEEAWSAFTVTPPRPMSKPTTLSGT